MNIPKARQLIEEAIMDIENDDIGDGLELLDMALSLMHRAPSKKIPAAVQKVFDLRPQP